MKTVPSKKPAGSASDPSTIWKLRAALVAIVCLVYANAFGLGAALDGYALINLDPRIKSLDNFGYILTTDYWGGADQLYRPLTTLSFLFNYTVLGNETRGPGYHAVNIFLHAVNVLLVFGLARRFFGRRWPAFFAAALWAVHPVGVESVTNIAGRADLLVAAALLGALTVYTRWAEGQRWMRAVSIFGLAAAAIASKENGAMLIPLMLAWDTVEGRLRPELLKARWLPYLAAAAPMVVYLAMRARVFAAMAYPLPLYVDNPLRGAGFWEARWTAVRFLGEDLKLLIWPAKLTCDRTYDCIRLSTAADPWAWASLAAAVGFAAIAIARRREDRALAMGAAFAATILPASNLIVLIGATLAERFLYLPAIGFCLAVVTAVYRFVPRRTAAAALLGVLAVLFAARTFARNPNWDNSSTLMAHDEQVTPCSFRIHYTYGADLAKAGQLDHAIAEIEAAWAILKDLPPDRKPQHIPNLLGLYYLQKGDASPGARRQWAAKAAGVLEESERLHQLLQSRFARLQQEHGKPPVRWRSNEDVYLMLGNAYRELGRKNEALERYREARRVDPANIEGYDRATAIVAESAPGTAALLQLEKALATGTDAGAVARLAPWYNRVEDGACAVQNEGGVAVLNTNCPRVRADLCRALPELRQTYIDAQQPQRAAEFEKARERYGCTPQ